MDDTRFLSYTIGFAQQVDLHVGSGKEDNHVKSRRDVFMSTVLALVLIAVCIQGLTFIAGIKYGTIYNLPEIGPLLAHFTNPPGYFGAAARSPVRLGRPGYQSEFNFIPAYRGSYYISIVGDISDRELRDLLLRLRGEDEKPIAITVEIVLSQGSNRQYQTKSQPEHFDSYFGDNLGFVIGGFECPANLDCGKTSHAKVTIVSDTNWLEEQFGPFELVIIKAGNL